MTRPTGRAGDRADVPRRGEPGLRLGEIVARVLLVGDVLPVLELQRHYLKRTSCTILTARTGREALAACRRERPDLALMDAAIPDIDGIEACRILKADPLMKAIPVILAAAAGAAEACHAAGCDDVMVKPITQAAFLDTVRRFVALRERQENRIPASLRVEFTAGAGRYTAYTRDISSRGLFLKSPRPFSVGTLLKMLVHLPAGTVTVEGEVRRIVERVPGSHLLPGLGVAFVDPEPEPRRLIDAFIRDRLAG
jgi:CheY-like chemotaxis protein